MDGRFARHLEGRISYAYQHTEDRATGDTLSNSPRHLAKCNLLHSHAGRPALGGARGPVHQPAAEHPGRNGGGLHSGESQLSDQGLEEGAHRRRGDLQPAGQGLRRPGQHRARPGRPSPRTEGTTVCKCATNSRGDRDSPLHERPAPVPDGPAAPPHRGVRRLRLPRLRGARQRPREPGRRPLPGGPLRLQALPGAAGDEGHLRRPPTPRRRLPRLLRAPAGGPEPGAPGLHPRDPWRPRRP